MALSELQRFSVNLSPIIVSSPTTRSGTTLLQRLISSASEFLIFGENCFSDLELLLGVYRNKALMYAHYQKWMEATRRQTMDEGTDEWIANLMPDLDGYIDAIGRGCFSGLEYCREYAAQKGRPSWGFKFPGLTPDDIQTLFAAMPGSKLVYVYRSATDCVKSAKSKELVQSESDVEAFARSWTVNLSYALDIAGRSDVCLMAYEDLMSEPEREIRRLESFTGALDIDRTIIAKKVNDGTIENASVYLEPTTLSNTEYSIVERLTSALTMRLSQ